MTPETARGGTLRLMGIFAHGEAPSRDMSDAGAKRLGAPGRAPGPIVARMVSSPLASYVGGREKCFLAGPRAKRRPPSAPCGDRLYG